MFGKVEGRKEEFIEYAKIHTLEETAGYFDIQKAYAQRLRREWCGIVVPRTSVVLDEEKDKFVEILNEGGYNAVSKYFNISIASVYHYCLKWGLTRYNKTKMINGYNIQEEFPEYAKNHTMRECSEYFGISISALRWWCEKYKVNPKIRRRTLKQVARLLYILDDGQNVFYFTNLDDIAEFVGLTRTRVNMLILQESKIHQYNVKKAEITSYRVQADRK